VNTIQKEWLNEERDNMKPIFFSTQSEFRLWLDKNHESETELLVGFYKVDSGKQSMTWSQSVDQAICYGWIDGVRKSIDEESYCIRFTPRKCTSIWSAINIEKFEALMQAGLMKPEGIKAFSSRTEEKSKIYAYENEPTKLDTEYERQFKSNKSAWDFFINQSTSYKNTMIHWIMSAKQEKTRLSRLEKTIGESELQRRMK